MNGDFPGGVTSMPFPVAGARFVISGSAGKARCEPGWNWRPQPLPDYDLWYALSGRGNMQIGDRTYPIGKGSCFILRPGDCPRADQDAVERLRVIYVHFEIRNASDGTAFVPDPLPARHTAISEAHSFEPLPERIVELAQHPDDWYLEEFDLLMKQVFLRLYREELELERRREPEKNTARKQRRLVAQVTALLRENPGQRMTHAEIAAEVGLSPEYLNRLFKKHTGLSLKETMTRIRLERARQLLLETSMNVTQVADSLGYGNVYLFSKQFKKHFGEPPFRLRWLGIWSVPHGARRNWGKPDNPT